MNSIKKNGIKNIDPKDLIPMDLLTDDFPIVIDLAYARADNLLFGERIYEADTRLFLHRDLARIVVLASLIIWKRIGANCILYDGLRTTDAQEAMLKTRRVQDNPHWLEEPRLLSPPGAGGHPRGMAIDMSIAGLDMGTPFDDLSEAAHRDYPHPPGVLENRALLTDSMVEAAKRCGILLLPLPQEWWDFRFPAEIYEQYAPISDKNPLEIKSPKRHPEISSG